MSPELNSEISITRNPISRILEDEIRENGPIPFDVYMDAWNLGKTDRSGRLFPGFYNSSQTTIGSFEGLYTSREYDFSTLPETTPLYGFMVGRQIAQMWELMGKDPDFQIVEMGAGNGTFAHDIIHGLRHFAPDMDIKYTIVEYSEVLAERQREKLADFGVDVIHASAVEELPHGVKGVFISNELLDDLPAKMVRRRRDGGWEELFIDSNDPNQFNEVWKPSSPSVTTFANRYLKDVPMGDAYPVSLAGQRWVGEMAKSLDAGYIFTADYYKLTNSRPYEIYSSESKGGVRDPITNRIDFYHKENVGRGGLTSMPDFRALHLIGGENGLNTVVDVTIGGFMMGLDYTVYVKMTQGMTKDERESLLGNREYYAYLAAKSLTISSHRVLVQTKNIGSPELLGGRFVFHDTSYNEIDRFFRDNFLLVTGQMPEEKKVVQAKFEPIAVKPINTSVIDKIEAVNTIEQVDVEGVKIGESRFVAGGGDFDREFTPIIIKTDLLDIVKICVRKMGQLGINIDINLDTQDPDNGEEYTCLVERLYGREQQTDYFSHVLVPEMIVMFNSLISQKVSRVEAMRKVEAQIDKEKVFSGLTKLSEENKRYYSERQHARNLG